MLVCVWDFVNGCSWLIELLIWDPARGVERVGVPIMAGLVPDWLFGSIGGFCMSTLFVFVLGGFETPRIYASDLLNLFKIGIYSCCEY